MGDDFICNFDLKVRADYRLMSLSTEFEIWMFNKDRLAGGEVFNGQKQKKQEILILYQLSTWRMYAL